IAVAVTRTIASRGFRISGSGTFSTATFRMPFQQSAFMVLQARGGGGSVVRGCTYRGSSGRLPFRRRDLSRLHPLFEVAKVLLDLVLRLLLQKAREACAQYTPRRGVLQRYVHLRTAACRGRLEANRSGMRHFRTFDRTPGDPPRWLVVGDLRMPFHRPTRRCPGNPMGTPLLVLRHTHQVIHEPGKAAEVTPDTVERLGIAVDGAGVLNQHHAFCCGRLGCAGMGCGAHPGSVVNSTVPGRPALQKRAANQRFERSADAAATQSVQGEKPPEQE